MKLKNILTNQLICLPLLANTKQEVLSELLGLLVASGLVSDQKLALSDILAREDKMTTGIQNGVAIPHAKTEAVEKIIACVGIKPEGLDFKALDGKLSRIFILMLSPNDGLKQHVQFLAEISRIMKSEEVRTRMIHATDKSEILSVFGL
ncbi:PTS sugar transporter subunit IIA [uncultured Sphaerochaeta sp.]|uniref:PTS sugar transporter subunit IIA n=1 Tax=uncultured Sphaerochaeta sp. TaxID=886478 RepID=UPI002A0A86E8|nr:PTS sugar transporter subunit IIA [uncultured Sphaerochaeta sp.]